MTTATYSRGLHDVSMGCHAWMQPDGGWGLSNAGLVTGSGASMLIDTLFDLPSTSEMLAAMAVVTDRQPITTVVNTHSDGDHFGNQLVAGDGVQIIASQAAAELMTEEAVDEIAALSGLPGAVGEFARKIFSPFGFDAIVLTGPTQTFSGEHPRSHANQDVDNGHIGRHTGESNQRSHLGPSDSGRKLR